MAAPKSLCVVCLGLDVILFEGSFNINHSGLFEKRDENSSGVISVNLYDLLLFQVYLG